jgi:hypothetical protein
MTINAVIKRPSRIIANTIPLVETQSNPPIVLKNNIPGISQNYLHNLLDVVERNPQEGDTLVYNATTDKYEVKTPEFVNVDLDGGTF